MKNHPFLLITLGLGLAVLLFNSIEMSQLFQTSFATNEQEYDIANRMGVIMPILSFAIASACTVLWHKGNNTAFAFSCALLAMFTIYELHGNLGYFSNMNANFENNSSINQLQKQQLDTANAKVQSLSEFHGINTATLQTRLTQYQNQFNQAGQRLNACPPGYNKNCKIPAQNELNQLQIKIDDLRAKISGSQQYKAAIDAKQNALTSALGNDDLAENKKTHAAFQSASILFFGNIHHAKKYQALWNSFLSFMLVFSIPLLAMIITSISMNAMPYSMHKKMDNAESFLNSIVDKFKPTESTPTYSNRTHAERGTVTASTQNTAKMVSDFDVSALLRRETQESDPQYGQSTGYTKFSGKADDYKRSGDFGFIQGTKVDLNKKAPSTKKAQREQISTNARAQMRTSTGRGEDSLKGYLDLKHGIESGDFEAKTGKAVGVRSIKEYCKVGTTKAQKLLAQLQHDDVVLD